MTIGETRTSTPPGSSAGAGGAGGVVAAGRTDGVDAAVDGRRAPAGRPGRGEPFPVVNSALLSTRPGDVGGGCTDGAGGEPSPQAGGVDGAQVGFAHGCASLAGADGPPTSSTPTPSAAPPSTATTTWRGVIRQAR
jgi:hypothetical protein